MNEELESRIRADLRSLAESIKKRIVADSSVHFLPGEKALLRQTNSLFYKPDATSMQTPEGKILQATGGTWYGKLTRDNERVDQFFLSSIPIAPAFQHTLNTIAEAFDVQLKKSLTPELYLTIFSYKLLLAFIEQREESIDLDGLIVKFLKDIREQGLVIVGNMGLDGLAVTESEVSLGHFSDGEFRLRELRFEDVNQPVLLKSQWDGDSEDYVSPEILVPRVFLVFEANQVSGELNREQTWFDVRFTSPIKIFDLSIQLIDLQLKRGFSILTLFQSKVLPRIKYNEYSFHLRNLSPDEPVYRFKAFAKKEASSGRIFCITPNQKDALLLFWKKMVEWHCWDRIYPASVIYTGDSPWDSTPLTLAYRRYREILAEDPGPKETIHNAIVALEGFFTRMTERYVFKRRVSTLLRVLKLDPNNTASRLKDAWEIRSTYSHSGGGWEKDSDSTPAVAETASKEALSNFLEENYKRELAMLVRNYLRVAIVSRISTNRSDVDFLKLLDEENQKGELGDELRWLGSAVSADALVKIKNPSEQMSEYK